MPDVSAVSTGGKGANQAVQVARLGVSVAMCGKVGPDSFGKEYLEHLKEEGVNVEHVEQAYDVSKSAMSKIF